MDPDPPSPSPRKVKFRPKAPPPRRTRRHTTTEIEEDSGDDSEAQQFLSRRLSEHLARRGAKVEKKSPAQVAFSHGVASSTIRSFGRQRQRTDDGSERTNDGSSAAYSEASTTGEMQDHFTSIPTAETQGVADNTVDLTDAAIVKKKKEYREPWDYHHSYYPITLPLRRPHSGNPEVLDKAEFEGALEYDENTLKSAEVLGLLDQDDTPKMLLFVFPSNLPVGRRPTNASRRETDDNMKAVENSRKNGKGNEKVMVGSVAKSSGNSNGIKGKEIAGSSIMSGYPLKKDTHLEELPEGYMGKMFVYRSGAVKLKLGDIMFLRVLTARSLKKLWQSTQRINSAVN
ncbi:uncharacterized protein LOC131011445 isoform X2 [Salvia miltiorrhiza]|uniref:uncharacterized protein LOC131011445 isoform X2 n=1 Tax=Salvia miltiorrhiza TaxID=226208 RepID=UPI0025ABF232|nr:uncharacterized protein LOC131011445 isoform X2 [Salvia miltiorrhiza]